MDLELFYLVNNNILDDAKKVAYKYIKQYQNNEKFVILFLLFQISDAENAAGEYNIFKSPAAGSVNSLIRHYTKIKFYLRRYEYDMPPEILKEAYNYFFANKVSVNALYKLATFACVNQTIVYKRLAQIYKDNGMFAQAKTFDSLSYQTQT